MNQLSKLIKEQREEFEGTVWHSRLKEFDRTTTDEEEQDHPTEMFTGLLELRTTALLQEIQRLIDQNYNPLAPVTLITIIEESIQEALDDINK